MITNERIDELLRQKAKIWGIGKQGNVFCVGLKFRPDTLKNKKWLENKYEVYSKFFETKEEAEWHKEFGCIERTERLELPTWEEFKCIYFRGEDCCDYKLCKDCSEIMLKVSHYDENHYKDYYCWELTKENYILACRKAKELFLGVKDE